MRRKRTTKTALNPPPAIDRLKIEHVFLGLAIIKIIMVYLQVVYNSLSFFRLFFTPTSM
jgi:hypothetical protein